MDERRYREAEAALWRKVGLRPSERLLELPAVGATVRVQEVGEGPPVVFVHGASNGGTSWAPLVAGLPGFRSILVDRPGCALSPALDRRFAGMAELGAFADELVVAVLDALELASANLIATSFGGYFALRAAAAHPARIDRLVELSWPFGAPMDSTPVIMRLAMVPLVGRLGARIPPTERMARSLLKQIGLRHAVESGRFGPAEMGWFLSLLRDTDTMRNELDTVPRLVTLRGFNDETLLPAALLARVACPALFVWGIDDPNGGAGIARTFVGRLPDAELELMPRAGHAPWMDDPEHVAARIQMFLHR